MFTHAPNTETVSRLNDELAFSKKALGRALRVSKCPYKGKPITESKPTMAFNEPPCPSQHPLALALTGLCVVCLLYTSPSPRD
eukprot:5942000-Alexandrium_andersonii.AAC.1